MPDYERTCCATSPSTAHTGTCPNSVMRCGEERFLVNHLPKPQPTTTTDRLFLVTVFYESPWERLSTFLLGVHRDNRDAVRWRIPDNPRGWRKTLLLAGNWADERDRRWRFKYAVQNRNPRKCWRRDGKGDPRLPGTA